MRIHLILNLAFRNRLNSQIIKNLRIIFNKINNLKKTLLIQIKMTLKIKKNLKLLQLRKENSHKTKKSKIKRKFSVKNNKLMKKSKMATLKENKKDI